MTQTYAAILEVLKLTAEAQRRRRSMAQTDVAWLQTLQTGDQVILWERRLTQNTPYVATIRRTPTQVVCTRLYGRAYSPRFSRATGREIGHGWMATRWLEPYSERVATQATQAHDQALRDQALRLVTILAKSDMTALPLDKVRAIIALLTDKEPTP